MKNVLNSLVVPSKLILSVVFVGSSIFSTTDFARAEIPTSNTGVQIAQSDRYTRQIGVQLVRAAKAAGQGGLRLTHDPFVGDLGGNGEDDITVNLRKGVSYAIVGVCDEDCNDIDLKLYDDNGNLIASDTETDDNPVVTVSPRWNARFKIRVVMPKCSNAPCRYGIGVFGK
ncbi:hypothetical protein [Nostoc sp. CENA543]|uniref:hypothetical protein n=1 Tax=Nostoc sp. CENA543 TaxID=1869241 RepID=UPI001CEFAB27|nr:hypothetical protein [Nostoc sp. CENA543]